MLTCKTVTPERAVSYFLQGYYLEGTSRWYGRGAEKLGLQGAVDNEQIFTNIVQGMSPDGTSELSSRKVETRFRRAGLDCTFSAPKSVSLTALVGGDERLIDAHHLAVEQTLFLIQERYAHTRVTMGSGRQVVNTGNLVVAEFDHIETRELDPHLHTHALIMNMTQLPLDEWYSHLNEAIYANKKFLGMVYQHYLALEVQKLGYSISPREHGQFDIKGYTEEQLMDFSKRRQQILAAVGAHSSWAERSAAWDTTRKRKEKVSPEELKAKWQSEALALGITFVKPGEPQPEHKPSSVSQKSLEDAIAHCSERTVAFKQEDLEKFILSEGRPFDVTQLEPAIKESNELIRIAFANGMRFTTEAALQRELATIRLMQQGQGSVQAIAPLEVVECSLEKTTLNSGQRQAVQLAATTTDQFIAWQGVAGAGKTFALKELSAIATAGGYTVIGFAPSSMAALVLSKELDVQAETVARKLVSKQPLENEPNQMWIVDEAGLLSAKDAHALLQRATQEKARVVLVGDTKQLSAVEAGNPFRSLQQAGIRTA